MNTSDRNETEEFCKKMTKSHKMQLFDTFLFVATIKFTIPYGIQIKSSSSPSLPSLHRLKTIPSHSYRPVQQEETAPLSSFFAMLLTCDLPCVKRILPTGEERMNRNVCYKRPHYIGFKILLCGKKDSHFPYQLFVGPDWPCMLVTYSLIIIPTTLFTIYIADKLSIALTIATILSGLIVLLCFSYAACSDPGVVYQNPSTEDAILEEGGAGYCASSIEILFLLLVCVRGVGMMECNHCAIMRPSSAMHCYDCGVCVDKLDHHCPWTGKCIGIKTLAAFYWFLFTLLVHTIYVAALSLYYVSYH